MNNTSETNRKDNTKKIILVRFIVSTVVVLALLLAISYAWFTNEADMATLIEVNSPSQVSVLGPHGKDMESIDMSYTDSDKNGDRVTIRRVISVSNSADSHQLEIAHTTNLRHLHYTKQRSWVKLMQTLVQKQGMPIQWSIKVISIPTVMLTK